MLYRLLRGTDVSAPFFVKGCDTMRESDKRFYQIVAVASAAGLAAFAGSMSYGFSFGMSAAIGSTVFGGTSQAVIAYLTNREENKKRKGHPALKNLDKKLQIKLKSRDVVSENEKELSCTYLKGDYYRVGGTGYKENEKYSCVFIDKYQYHYLDNRHNFDDRRMMYLEFQKAYDNSVYSENLDGTRENIGKKITFLRNEGMVSLWCMVHKEKGGTEYDYVEPESWTCVGRIDMSEEGSEKKLECMVKAFNEFKYDELMAMYNKSKENVSKKEQIQTVDLSADYTNTVQKHER